jgi:decaprenyl-phosphate phosphoribosyltransferase
MSIGEQAGAVAFPAEQDRGQAVAPPILAVHGAGGRRRLSGSAAALIRACRPRQWSKNLLVLAAPGAAGVLLHRDVPGRVALAFIAFCMLASATYLFNDLRDREEDMAHPRKRSRPIAAGETSPTLASVAMLLLAAGGLAIAAHLSMSLLALAGGYLALTASYTLLWRHVAVADIAVVASGFVIRALAGGLATGVSLSRWFVIVTSFGALFLVAGKRYAELARALAELRAGQGDRSGRGVDETEQPLSAADRRDRRGLDAEELRRALEEGSVRNALYSYTIPYLRFVMILAAAVAVGAYCLWAFQHRAHGTDALYDLTILPFVLWLLRYALLLDQGAGEAPEELLFSDPFLIVSSIAWVGLFAGSVYAGS